VTVMEERVYIALLYDFYGGLLTDKQKEMLEMYYLSDLSLQEIGESAGVSRQAVSDLLRRTKKLLLDYEARLGLADRHMQLMAKVDMLDACADAASTGNKMLAQMKDILEEIRLL